MAEGPSRAAVPAAFFDSLPKFFQSHELANGFRVVKDGVFVQEDRLDALVKAYQDWLKENSGNPEGRSLEKCWKRLIGTEEPVLLYALDGKRCIPGFVVKSEAPNPQVSKIPVYRASLLPTSSSLHPRDPFIERMAPVRTRTNTNEGLVLEFPSASGRVDVTEQALSQFAQFARSSPRLLARYPDAKKALRNVVEPLKDMLASARVSPPGQRLLVPNTLRGKSNLRFLKSQGVYFVIEGEHKLLTTFCIVGKALPKFIRSEIDAMAKAKQFLQGFEPLSPKKGCIGKLFTQGIAFHLHMGALLQFLKQAQSQPKLRKKLDTHFTVVELIERLVALYRSSQPVDEITLLGKLRRREAYAKYRRTGNWVFVLQEKTIVTSCVHLRAAG